MDAYRETDGDHYPPPTNVQYGPITTTTTTTSTRKPTRHSRNTSTVVKEPFIHDLEASTSDAAQPGVITYPGNDSSNRNGTGLQRSFSQRARGRPFAEEAFADEMNSDRANNTAKASDSRSGALDDSVDWSEREGNASGSRRQQMIQDNIRSAAAEAARSQLNPTEPELSSSSRSMPSHHSSRNPAPVDTQIPGPEPPLQPEQREWAQDKSPLQKLKVTLDSISKEEKRARMQEAEILHREKTRSRKHPETIIASSAREQPTASVPMSGADGSGIVRGLSNTHRDRLQHSTVIESRKPDPTILVGDKRGFDYQSTAGRLPPGRSVTITRRGQRVNSQPTYHSSVTVPDQASHIQTGVSQPRSVSSTQPASRARALADPDQTISSLDRNASHKAALNRLEGEPKRTSQQPLDRHRVETYNASTPPVSGQFQRSTRDSSSGIRSQPSSFADGQLARGTIGYQGSPDIMSVDSPALDDRPTSGHRQKRRSSVSFKEPFDRRRPVDEWKSAETARLVGEDFLTESQTPQTTADNKAWWEQDAKSRRRSSRAQAAASSAVTTESVAIDDRTAEYKPALLVKCGPLLRYTGMKRTTGAGAKEYWRGTVLLVTKDSQSSYEQPPVLRLFAQPKTLYKPGGVGGVDREASSTQPFDPLTGCVKVSRIGRALFVRPHQSLHPNVDLSSVETDDGLFMSTPPGTITEEQSVSVSTVAPRLSDRNGEYFSRHREVKGVRLYADPDRDATFWLFKLEVQLGVEQQHIGYRINGGAASGFWVPAERETMHVMFHSCNGFSATVKTEDFGGPDPLWRNVLNVHQSKPFHVMVGGGDQIYNDKVMYRTQHFAEWCSNKNPHHKHHAPLTSEMSTELESFYLENYSSWFSQGLFSMAASQIPMVNMWDDHDIIDGFGSYPHAFQQSPVFRGIGNIAYKYYMLFQQHSIDAMTTADEPSWVLGYKPGPYIKHLSRSIFLDFGRELAFLALDCRTERMKDQVLSEDTRDIALERCRKEIIEGQTKHLIVLLGVPIAYPRLNWLENVLTSKAMDPIKALGRYGVVKGGFLNRFDGGVEVLDDLDDHWTANHHKQERNEFVEELQDLAAERSVRITILGGDVHLGAIGQFYSNPKLKIPKDRDHRYMPNIISSAIVNTPPPDMLADVLNKRNKVHHLNIYTDESMIPMFTHDVDGKKRNNKHLLPRRNWCSISQYAPGRTPQSSRSASPAESVNSLNDANFPAEEPKRRFSFSREDNNPRGLLRRLSSRKAPPNAYDNPYKSPRPLDPRVDGNNVVDTDRAASFDDMRADGAEPRSWNDRLRLTRRTASETRGAPTDSQQSIRSSTGAVKPPPFRPGFHRRPTNLSEKAARKGNVPAVDAEGNEIDVNDHVNLDGGLDIILNFEIDKGDPSGDTQPYRLLVPALWYDGSSDREKLHGAGDLQRKPTLMNRLGIGSKRSASYADQGAEFDGSDAYSATDSENEQGSGKKGGLFGSLRRKSAKHEGERALSQNTITNDAPTTIMTPTRDIATGDGPLTAHRTQHSVAATTTPEDTPPRPSVQPANTHSISKLNYDPLEGQNSKTGKGNVLRKNSLKRQSPPEPQNLGLVTASNPASRPSEFPQQGSQILNLATQPSSSQQAYVAAPGSIPLGATTGRLPHRTISDGTRGPNNRSYPTQPGFVQNSSRAPPSADGLQTHMQQLPPSSYSMPQTDTNTGAQQGLRGNGILGRFGLRRNSSTGSKSSDQYQSPQLYSEQAQHDNKQFNPPQRSMSQGYSGIEAYREQPKRGLSLKDRARNLFDRIEGRQRYDEDDYSYDSQDSFSDDLGEHHDRPEHQHQNQSARSNGYKADDAAPFSQDDEADHAGPKRGLSQKFRLGMMRMGSRKGASRDEQDPEKDESRYY